MTIFHVLLVSLVGVQVVIQVHESPRLRRWIRIFFFGWSS
jgi:hypothetical protein